MSTANRAKGNFNQVATKHKDKLPTQFKKNGELIEERVLMCGRKVEMRKTQFGWTWALHIAYHDNASGRLMTQDIFLQAEKDADGKADPNGYFNSIFRDKELDWPVHSLRLELMGKKHILNQYVDESCPCARMTEDDLQAEGEEEIPF